jgi:hypothetical protein
MDLPNPQRFNDNDQRVKAIVLVAVLLALGLLFCLVTYIHHGVPYEDCHIAGFRNCVSDPPVITSPHRRDKLE